MGGRLGSRPAAQQTRDSFSADADLSDDREEAVDTRKERQ